MIDGSWIKDRLNTLIDAALVFVALRSLVPAVLQDFEFGLISSTALLSLLALIFAVGLVQKNPRTNEKDLAMHSPAAV